MTINLTLSGVSAEEWDLSHFLMQILDSDLLRDLPLLFLDLSSWIFKNASVQYANSPRAVFLNYLKPNQSVGSFFSDASYQWLVA